MQHDMFLECCIIILYIPPHCVSGPFVKIVSFNLLIFKIFSHVCATKFVQVNAKGNRFNNSAIKKIKCVYQETGAILCNNKHN